MALPTGRATADRARAAGDSRFAGPLRATRPAFRAEQLRWAWDNLTPPPRSAVDVGSDDLGYIMDLESFEVEPQPSGETITYRWTMDNSTIRLTAPPGDSALVLKVRWHSLSWPGKPDPDAEVTIIANGVQAGKVAAHPSWEVISLPLPRNVSNGPVTIELQTKAERPPGPDLRLLGVAVDRVELERSK